MRVLNAVQRLLLLLLLIPVLAICLDTLLRAFGAQKTNPIVAGVRDFANIFLIEPFKTVFPKQSYLQDALVALAAFGVLALLIVFLFRGLRALAGSRPPSVRTAPAPAAAKSRKTETIRTETSKTDSAKAERSKSDASKEPVSADSSADKTEADSSTGTTDDTKSTSA